MLAAVGHAFLPCGHAVDDLREECSVCQCYYNAKEEIVEDRWYTDKHGPFKGIWHMADDTWADEKSLRRFKEDEINRLTTSDFRGLQKGDKVWKACGDGQWIHATFLEFATCGDGHCNMAIVNFWNSARYVDRYSYFWELAFLRKRRRKRRNFLSRNVPRKRRNFLSRNVLMKRRNLLRKRSTKRRS